MAIREILLLGNPALHAVCDPVRREERRRMEAVAGDLHDTLLDFRKKRGAGRAVAAPQIGVSKRVVYMLVDEPVVFLNPVIERRSRERILVWDDCMSFPDLLVRVRRHRACRIRYRDLDWNERFMDLEDDLSELLQHETDHLDGILAVSRAVDGQSFALRSERRFLDAPFDPLSQPSPAPRHH